MIAFKTKISYGITAVADQCLFYLYGTFFMFFLTTVAGVSPGAAGIISAVGAVWDAFMAVVAGHISDNAHTRYGKRKPFVMSFAIPMAAITALMFSAFEMSYIAKIIYFTVVTMLYWSFFPLFFIPFLAWGAELTEDYAERTTLRSFAYVGNTVGMAIGTLLPSVMVAFFAERGFSEADSWQKTMMLVALAVGAVLLFGPMGIKSESNALSPEEKQKMREERSICKGNGSSLISSLKPMLSDFSEILKLKTLIYILSASILYLMASTIFAADRMYFFTYSAQLSAKTISALMAVATFSGVLLLPVVTATRKTIDKKIQYTAGMFACAIAMLICRFVYPNSIVASAIVMFAFGVSNMLYWQLLPAMLYDVCEVDELVYGKQRQGTIVSLQSLVESVSEAVGMLTIGFVLELAGFAAEAEAQPASAIFWVSNCFTVIPVIFMAASAVLIFIYPITSKNFAKVVAAVRAQREGEKPDLDEFKELL